MMYTRVWTGKIGGGR
uniref:Uncharacterized protein n=1 Tax=Bursaphelenchus xylophilus TaxID=6326 RepID=A0A1I7SH28_BURXY